MFFRRHRKPTAPPERKPAAPAAPPHASRIDPEEDDGVFGRDGRINEEAADQAARRRARALPSPTEKPKSKS